MKYVPLLDMKKFDEIIGNLKAWVEELPDDESQQEKPPLGVMPRKLWQEQVSIERKNCLSGAITRYLQRGMEVPEEWVDEYNELKSGIIKFSTDKPEEKKPEWPEWEARFDFHYCEPFFISIAAKEIVKNFFRSELKALKDEIMYAGPIIVSLKGMEKIGSIILEAFKKRGVL